ncbi:rod shape-determining protein MreC [Alphaproteobacteria bacterium]|nr:rod shape-determining protein MreC [Alphaproteobacteria bacterium]
MRMFKPKSRSGILATYLPFMSGRAAYFSLFILCAFLILLSAIKPQIVDKLRLSLVDLLAPVVKTISIPLQSAVLLTRDMTEISKLQSENIRLEEENVRLREWYQAALVLESDNKALRTLLNVKEKPQQTFVTARIISDSANRFVKTVLVSVGYADGVKKNQAVLAGDGLIGRVIEVGKNVSRILLLTDINSKVPVLVAGTNQYAILSGENNDVLTLEYLDKDSPVHPGMKIITSGHAGVFPPDIAVGEVFRVDKDGASVRLFNDLDRIIYVRIVDFPQNADIQKIGETH